MNKMKKGIMLALAIVVLVTTIIGHMNISAYNSQHIEQHYDIWTEYAVTIDTTQEPWFLPMKGMFVSVDPLLYMYDPDTLGGTWVIPHKNWDVTVTFSAQFLIFAKSDMPAPLPLVSIEVGVWIFEPEYPTGWIYFGRAKPWKAVMLTEEPDATGKNWQSRSFTFVYNGLPESILSPGLFQVRWRLYPASPTLYEAQVRCRSLVVTVNHVGRD